MKYGFASKNNYKSIIIFLLFFLFFFPFLFTDFFTKTIRQVARPLIVLATTISEDFFWWSKSNRISSQELEDLYQQKNALAVERMLFEQWKDENRQLKKELDFVERSSSSYIPASIIIKSISQTVRRFVIDAGSDQGIEVGNPVLVQEGIFVGKIEEVRKNSSTVTSMTDPGQAIAVSLLNESRTIGVASATVNGLL